MTITTAMEILADFLAAVLAEHTATTSDGTETAVKVYAGYPPVRSSSAERESFAYCLATKATDEDYSKCEIEIGFSIYDNDPQEGWRNLFNCMEHVRQAILLRRTIGKKLWLELPMTTEVVAEQTFPQWCGKITAVFNIGQPAEGINYDDIQESATAYGIYRPDS